MIKNWSSCCWFDVNRSTFYENMRKFCCIFVLNDLVLWLFDLKITSPFVSAWSNLLMKCERSTVFQYWVNERNVRDVADRQTFNYMGRLSKGSFWSRMDMSEKTIFLHFCFQWPWPLTLNLLPQSLVYRSCLRRFAVPTAFCFRVNHKHRTDRRTDRWTNGRVQHFMWPPFNWLNGTYIVDYVVD